MNGADEGATAGHSRDPLERALVALSAPVEPAAPLWERALAQRAVRGSRRTSGSRPAVMNWFARRPVWSLAAVVAIGGVAIALAFQGARGGTAELSANSVRPSSRMPAEYFTPVGVGQNSLGTTSDSEFARSDSSPSAPGAADQSVQPADAAQPRLVARKAAIDLRTLDVSGVFSKAAFIVSEASGEYVESSALTGAAEHASGTLTLRVRAERLSVVLNELRKLGDVASETTSGDDVTDRAVDLESRIRNEERVEAELLELLAKRDEAPLKEILELRDSLSRVRGSIEIMRAQRDRLSNLVSLATILVHIRHGEADEPEPSGGLWTYITDRFERTVSGAARALVDSLLWILGLLIAGALWWLILAAAVVGIVVLRRRNLRARAAEPAPRLA